MNLSVDPGIDGTGIAGWNSRPPIWRRAENPELVLNIYPKKLDVGESKTLWVARVNSLVNEFENTISECEVGNDIHVCYCEFPKFFDSSVKGRAAIVTKKNRNEEQEPGDVFKLTFLIGCYAEVCRQYKIDFIPVMVGEWNGQLSKSLVQSRIRLLLPEIDSLKPKAHSWDAIGVGLHAKGFEL